MDKYLTIDESAKYLSVSVDTIKRYVEKGELPTYKLERALRFKVEDLDNLVTRSFEVLLTRGLRAVVTHIVQTEQNKLTWRAIVQFMDTTADRRLVSTFGSANSFSEYYVFVSGEYLKNIAKLPETPEGAEKFALRYITERFQETADGDGSRDIRRIEENKVACSDGSCRRGEQL